MDLQFKIIAALALGAGIVAALLIWRARQPVALKPVCCGEPAAEAEAPQSAFGQRLLSAIDYLRTRREWRYRTPWILLLGQQGAGKSSLLASASAQYRQPLQGKQKQLAVDGADWHFFGKGFLIDPSGKLPSALDGSKDAKAWAGVLDQIDALRPERALDGLLVAVSARTLQQADPAERLALAENIRGQLRTIQDRFEFALPVYVVVTATDTVEGFAAFWRSQPVERRSEMVGWSAPTQNANGLPEQWAEAAFDSIGRQLKSMQAEAAANCERIAQGDADDFFLFPRHFQQLRAPFSQWLSVVFQPTAWQAGFFCRGVYFTGAVAAAGANVAAQESVRADLAFVDDLALEKVLAEPRLGRPTRQGVWSRNAQIRWLQAGALSILGLLLLALCLACFQASRQVENVVASLKLMQQLDKAPDAQIPPDPACIKQEAVYRLLTQIARIDTNDFYWSLPLSWFDERLTRQSARRIADGAFQNVVLPGIACQLRQRARDLYDAAPVDKAGAPSYTQSLAGLFDYIQQATALEQNLARFHSILGDAPYAKGQPLLADFIALTEYAYRDPLPAALKSSPGLLPATLAAVNAKTPLQLPNNLKQSASSRIAQQAQQVHGLLAQELQLGSRLLLKLDQKQEPVLANTKQFAQWLGWVRKSWLGSSVEANPIQQVRDDLAGKLAPLVRQYGYPEQTLNAASAQFDVNKEYRPAMQMLTSLQMASYGTLFTTQNNVLDLNPKLTAELNGLNALVALDFMQVDPTQPFICQSRISGWNAAQVAMANNYAQEYDRFARAQGIANADASPPLYDRLARHQLELVMGNSLQLAQLPASNAPAVRQTGIDFTSPADVRQEQESTDFGKLLQPLMTLQRTYRDKNFASGANIGQCVRNFAADSLGRIYSLAEQSLLYQPAPNNAANAASRDAAFFDLGGTQVIKDYLVRQTDRVQVLVRYATPFLNYLNNSDNASTAAQRSNGESAPYWNNTIAELNRALQAKDPSGQVALLENLFLKQLPGLTNANCSKTLAAYVPDEHGNDLFSIHRQQLEKQVQLRCKGVRHSQAYTAYNQLAARFNRELAGHYPFAPLDADDSSSTTARNFFTDYQTEGPALRQSLAGLDDPYWDKARSFLDQLDAAAKFFQGNLVTVDAPDPTAAATAATTAAQGSGDSGGNAIKLTVAFRAQAGDSPGSNQVVNWGLSSGSKSIGHPNRPNTLDWSYGQPLVVDLDWANYSLLRPALDNAQRDLKVDGTLASFAASGNWALLRLLERHRPASGNGADPLDAKRLLLQFDVPVANSEARFAKPGTATLFLAVGLSGAKGTVLKMPAQFPRLAPQ